jgi:hypothetical protein
VDKRTDSKEEKGDGSGKLEIEASGSRQASVPNLRGNGIGSSIFLDK